VFSFFIVPFLITFWLVINKERLAYWIPRLNYYSVKLLGFQKERIFTYTDVNNKKAILTHFNNIYLRYKATGDFSRYLAKVEILEHPYKIKIRFPFFPFLKRVLPNDLNYTVVFWFLKTPKIGDMMVNFM
jgi:hypothetical protein